MTQKFKISRLELQPDSLLLLIERKELNAQSCPDISKREDGSVVRRKKINIKIYLNKFKNSQKTNISKLKESDFALVRDRPETWSETTSTKRYRIRRLPGCRVNKQEIVKIQLDQNCSLIIGSPEVIQQAEAAFNREEVKTEEPANQEEKKKQECKARLDKDLNQLVNSVSRSIIDLRVNEEELQRQRYERERQILEGQDMLVQERLMFRYQSKEGVYYNLEPDQRRQQQIWKVLITKRLKFESGEFKQLYVAPKFEGDSYSDMVEWEESGNVEVFRQVLVAKGWDVEFDEK